MQQNSEGNIYKVCWKRVASGYSAWLARLPKLTVKGNDEEELCELLFEITMERFGDGEPCFDFHPPFEAQPGQRDFFDPEWFVINSNENFSTVGDRTSLFSDGICSHCGAGRGERTSAPRSLDGVPKSDFAFIWQEQPAAYIASENFLKVWKPLLGSSLRTRHCLVPKKTIKRFFELDLVPSVPLRAHSLATDTFGVSCRTCATEYAGSFICPAVGKGIFTAVERDVLTTLNRDVVVASGGMNRKICVSAKVAKKLKTKMRLKGVMLDRLMMLNTEQLGEFKLAKAAKRHK